MAASNAPLLKVELYNKTDNSRADVAVLWLNENGFITVQTFDESELEGKYRKASLSDSLSAGYFTTTGRKAGKYVNAKITNYRAMIDYCQQQLQRLENADEFPT